jgi:heme A synthase
LNQQGGRDRFGSFAWAVLAFNLGVIGWGAFVRATGSGAGCGSHWPLCNGQVFPRAPAVETLIEFVHRASSGMALVLVAILVVWGYRRFPRGALARRAAGWSGVFILTEALLGAGLVLFRLVAQDASATRAVSVALHLANTYLLLGALCLTAWWATHPDVGWGVDRNGKIWMTLAGLGMLLLGMSGAVTALGDTLFPVESLQQGLLQDLSASSHFLQRVRVLHPLLAILIGILVGVGAFELRARRDTPNVRRASLAVWVLIAGQWAAGLVNLALLAPIGIQLLHLLLSDGLWIAWVILCAAYAAAPGDTSPTGRTLA